MSDIPSPTPSPAEMEEMIPGMEATAPLVGILMGSESDRPVMEKACAELDERALSYEIRVISAHRNPKEVAAYAESAAPRGIRVNAISAGVVDTDALQYFPNREELLASFAHRTPAGPKITPEDVAGAVYLLCLPEAEMVNGHTLFVDGGFAISG